MNIQYFKHWSKNLNREIEYKIYGTEGQGVLVFPSQDQRFYEWEDNGMISMLSPMIEAGEIHLICADSIDAETWSNGLNAENPSFVSDEEKSHYHERIELHEKWYNYIVEELIPTVNNGEQLIVTGCSMGGYHAANFFFRRPDIFDTVIALSGLYHASYFFGDYSDELVYSNSPLDFLRWMPADHYYWDMYRHRRIICCVGQGNWEEDLLDSTRRLDTLLCEKGVPAWFDYWGHDVAHDWEWWRRQLPYFIGNVLG